MALSQYASEVVRSEIEKISGAAVVKIPLCVDLDGTLIKTDLLLECLLALLKQSPWAVFLIAWWSLHGWSFLKRELAAKASVPLELLPYRSDVLDFLHQEQESGRPLLLVTAADQAIAAKISAHLGWFGAVYGSDGTVIPRGPAN